ncbi:ABC-ATPase domain-containing protein [Bacillus luteus]|uniref:ABC-ATPase domain-containing protein n=2 Tax=Alkalicoccus luteus TaxID=1237094 RepID=A0A969PXB7_9BACI|nr:ABC-ATPase domain-containing protein [Alkalicoccus luteus]
MNELEKKLQQLDHQSYAKLKQIAGTYRADDGVELAIDYVQGDPFAAPSRVRVRIPMQTSRLRREDFSTPSRTISLKHLFTKACSKTAHKQKTITGTGKSGMIMIDAPGPEVIDRASVSFLSDSIEFRLSTGIPAAGRKILGKKAAELLTKQLPETALKAVTAITRADIEKTIQLQDDQDEGRRQIETLQGCAFIANGSVLPRASGISSAPMKNAVPFQSPSSQVVELELPHRGKVRGMLIKKGVTLIAGGGYHGKSTLLQALERGVYNHEAEDGRELVWTDESAVKIRAEDRRSVWNVDISAFINTLPGKKQTTNFSTEDASGSTSQAANMAEAMQAGSRLFLIDEDTSATNFMIRDARMQRLVSPDKEPITPFTDRIRPLYETHGISSILVLGGSGDYFEPADEVIVMDEYVPKDRTKEAKAIAASLPAERSRPADHEFPKNRDRSIPASSIQNRWHPKKKVQAKGKNTLLIGKGAVDLHDVEQLVSPSQSEALAQMIVWCVQNSRNDESLSSVIDRLYETVQQSGLESVSPFFPKHPGNTALPRKYELYAAFNRLPFYK